LTATEPVTRTDLLEAVTELGDALRHALDVASSTTAAADALRTAAVQIRAAVDPLAARPRPRHELPAVDDMSRGVRVYNPVVGMGSGIAVPLVLRPEGDGVVAHAEFGQRFEGPPTFLHGGIAALLMDQVLGQAAIVADRWGMTVDLDVRYRRPVPLHSPVRLTGRVAGIDGRRSTVVGTIAAVESPDAALVEATAVFVSPSPETAARYFAAVRTADGEQTSGRLGPG
jgi:acyl-coenzyme A thioesterase PaaI-like protein